MELVDLYNSKKENLNKTWVRDNADEPELGEYKLNVHMWLINNKNELLIQKRGKTVKRHPDKWAFTGGGVDTGENSFDGAKREIKEELGIDVDNLDLLMSFRREHDFVDVWVVRTNVEISELTLSNREVQEVKWANLEEIDDLVIKGDFVPSLKLYYELFKRLIEKCYIDK